MKYKYGDEVKVVSGFYRGVTGDLIEVREERPYESHTATYRRINVDSTFGKTKVVYRICLDDPIHDDTIWVEEKDLKLNTEGNHHDYEDSIQRLGFPLPGINEPTKKMFPLMVPHDGRIPETYCRKIVDYGKRNEEGISVRHRDDMIAE